jgi:hypothetical protein
MMDRSHIDAEHMVARYLAGQLSAADEMSFEGYAADHPEVFRDVESTLRLKEGLAVLRDRDELQTLMRHRDWRVPFAAAAAAVLLLVTLGIWAWWHVPSRTLILAGSPAEFVGDPSRPLPVAGTYGLIRSRGQGSAVEIAVPAQRSAIQIRVLPSEFAERGPYRASLERGEGNGGKAVVGEIGGLVAADDRFVTLYLDSSRLTPGDYEITLVRADAASPATEADRFTLRMK